MSFFKKYKYLSIILINLFLFFFQSVKIIFSYEDFTSSSTSTYIVNLEGKTAVQHQTSLTNKKIDVYPTQYALSVASTRIKNAWAKDETQTLKPSVFTTNNATTISVDFKKQSVGIGQTLTFFIGYEDDDITQKIGQVREVNIPRPEDIDQYSDYTIKLIVPNGFQSPVQIIPEPSSIVSGSESTIYTFVKSKLIDKGVTALFGENQIFSFDLRYSLSNSSPIIRNYEIALPPDTQYQKVIYEAIIPLPVNMKVDADGNWLAEYKVNPRDKLEIHAVGYAIINLNKNPSINQSEDNLDQYLKPEDPWPSNDPEIIKLAQDLKSPQNIYNYVVENLSYNDKRIETSAKRLGAKVALNNRSDATCMEFTDLFIALSRAANIPSRELNGFAYTQNPDLRPLSLRQDILHAWPEYFDYDQKRWVAVDPTWGNTTKGIDYFSRFDLNHFVFVIHGSNYQTPYPVGFYKTENLQGKDIDVKPSSKNPKQNILLNLDLQISDEITAGLTTRGKIKLQNHSNIALHNEKVKIISNELDILTPTEYNLSVLLPYTEVYFPLVIKGRKPFSSGNSSIKISILNFSNEKQIQIKSIIYKLPQLAIAMAMGAGFAIATSRSRRLLLPLKKRVSSLRRKSK